MSDGQRMKQIKESGYKYLGIIQDNEIKTQVMKDKIRTIFEESKKAKWEMYASNVLFVGINQ